MRHLRLSPITQIQLRYHYHPILNPLTLSSSSRSSSSSNPANAIYMLRCSILSSATHSPALNITLSNPFKSSLPFLNSPCTSTLRRFAYLFHHISITRKFLPLPPPPQTLDHLAVTSLLSTHHKPCLAPRHFSALTRDRRTIG